MCNTFTILILLTLFSCGEIDGLSETADDLLNMSAEISPSELQGLWKADDIYEHYSLSQVFDETQELDTGSFQLISEDEFNNVQENIHSCDINWSESHDIETNFYFEFINQSYKLHALLKIKNTGKSCMIILSQGEYSTYDRFIFFKDLKTSYYITKENEQKIHIGFTSLDI